jgi:hypothetical protein
MPSGGASAAFGLARLAALTGEHDYERAAEAHLRLVHRIAEEHPGGLGHNLQALDFLLGPTREVALVGGDVSALARVVRKTLRPHLVVAAGPGGAGDDAAVPLLRGRGEVGGQPAAYVCEGFACQRPVTAPEELEQLLA